MEADAAGEEYYDEEEDEPEEPEPEEDLEDEVPPLENATNAWAPAQEGEDNLDQEPKTVEIGPDGNPVPPKDEEESEYDSEYYDENGKYIWGEEGLDWEFYDQEDKDAYE